METHSLYFFVAALVPLVVGFVWYHPAVFGGAWQRGSGLPREAFEKGPKPTVFLIVYILGLLFALGLYPLVVHQVGVASLFATREGFGDPGSPNHQQFVAMMTQVQGVHRSFGHGALHGSFAGILIGLPILGINGMFEQKRWKYNFINIGYWLVTAALMGGILCQFA